MATISSYKSYTLEEIEDALAQGEEVWVLDTGNYGADDHLIGSLEEVRAAILSYHELAEMPATWTLERVPQETWEIPEEAEPSIEADLPELQPHKSRPRKLT